MPTAKGGETIGERLTRLRAELARVRQTIARNETNGGSFNMGGTQVTQIAYERALAREQSLQREIVGLEGRLAGTAARPGIALFATKMSG